jgi:hypothetical protein
LVNDEHSATNVIQILTATTFANVFNTPTVFVDPQAIGYDSVSGDFFLTDYGAQSHTVFTDRKIYRVHVPVSLPGTATLVGSAGSLDKPGGIVVAR